MGSISQWSGQLRSLPDQALQQELQNPTGVVPSYLVLAEAQRRALLRQAAQQQQNRGQSSTVLQDVVRNMQAQQPPPGVAPAGMTPPRQGQQPTPGQMPTPAPPQGMARGGTLRFAEGGADDGGDDESGEPDQPEDVSSTGEADRAAQPVNVDDLAEAMIQFEGSRHPSSPGFRDNNPGHLRYARQSGSQGHDALNFAQFPTWDAGLAAMKQQIRRNLSKGLTLSEMIGGKKGVYPGWAPASDNNNTANYIKYVAGKTGYDPNTLMSESRVVANKVPPAMTASPADYNAPPIAPPDKPVLQAGYAPPGTDLWGDLPTAQHTPPIPQPLTPDQIESDQPAPAQAGAAQAPPQAAPAQQPAPQTIPSTPDPYSPANIQRMRQTMEAIEGVSPEYKQQLAQTRAATIQQLQGLQQEQLARYHNPSPWEFLSSIAAGMGASKNLTFAGAFGEGVGHAWQVRDQAQQQALSNVDALQQRIDAVQNVGETERERQAGQLMTMLSRPPQGVQEFNALLGKEGVVYDRQDKPPGPDYAFRPDPSQPGYGEWVPTGKALKTGKLGSRADQEFNAAVKNLNKMAGLPEGTAFGDMPESIKLDKPITLPEDMPMPDGSVMKAGTVMPAGTTIFPQRMAQNLADRSKAEQAQATNIAKILSGPEGRQQMLAQNPDLMKDFTDEQRQNYIRSGKMPENINSLAQAVADLTMPLKEAMSRGQLSDRSAMIAKVRQINPSYREDDQEAQYKTHQATETKFGSGAQATRNQGIEALTHHMGVLYDAAAAMRDGGVTGNYTKLNELARRIGQQIGPTDQATYQSIVHGVVPELGKAYIATGGTEKDRKELEGDFTVDMPPDQILRNVGARAKLLGGVMDSMNNEYVTGTYGRGQLNLGFYRPGTITELNRIAPGAVKTVTHDQVQHVADQYFGGNFEAAHKHMTDAGYFLRQ